MISESDDAGRSYVCVTLASPSTPSSLDWDSQVRNASANAFEALHSSFMSMLVRVIRGQLESSVYEDQCRSLLGTGSYELFTLDKLSAKIVKHMQLMLQDETTTKLWELYK